MQAAADFNTSTGFLFLPCHALWSMQSTGSVPMLNKHSVGVLHGDGIGRFSWRMSSSFLEELLDGLADCGSGEV